MKYLISRASNEPIENSIICLEICTRSEGEVFYWPVIIIEIDDILQYVKDLEERVIIKYLTEPKTIRINNELFSINYELTIYDYYIE